MNYKNWPKKEIPIAQLFLDPLNPRMADKFEKATQTGEELDKWNEIKSKIDRTDKEINQKVY